MRTRKTSTRQCLYYLLDLTQSPDKFKVQNTFALEYWNDNAGHGGLEPAYSLTEQLQDLNIQPFGPRMKPPQPSGLMVKFTAESSVSHTGDFGEPDIKSSSSDTLGPIEHAQSGQDGHAFLRRKPEPVSPTPLPRSRIPLPLERSRLAHRAASLSPSRWKPVPDCPTSMPLSRIPVHRGSSIPTPKELPG